MKKIISILVMIAILTSISAFAFAAEKVDPAIAAEVSKNADDKVKAEHLAKTEDVDKAKVAERLAFKNALKELFNKLDALRKIAKDNWGKIQDLNVQIKAAMTAAKSGQDTKKLLAAVKKGDLAALHTQVKKVREEIVAIRGLKTTAWADFKAAVKAKSLDNARTALEKIIDYKSQIIDKQKELIKLKQDILAILKKAVAK